VLRAREREAWLLESSPASQPAAQSQPPLPLPLSIPRSPGQAVDPIPVQGSRG
jgi:hypothetical protein